jgi:hypothetical protein
MKPISAVWLPILLFAGSVSSQCTDEAPSDATTFVRKHEVHNFNAESPKWVEDELKLWSASTGEVCFTLRAMGANGHECGAEGSLDTVAKEHYRFSADVCSIDLRIQRGAIDLLVADTWRRLGEGGICPTRFQCGMYGAIDSGRFESSDTSKDPLRAAYVQRSRLIATWLLSPK